MSRLIPTPPPIDGILGSQVLGEKRGSKGVPQEMVPMSITGSGATVNGWGLVVLPGNACVLSMMPSFMFIRDVLVVAVKVLVVSLAQL